MNFKDYRHRENVRATKITESEMILPPYDQLDRQPIERDREPFNAGSYALLIDGELFGLTQERFENRFEPRRAERQSKATRKPRKARVATDAG